MKKLLDLRFVIGMFFLIVGVLLTLYHFIATPNPEMNTAVNIWAGIIFIIFGVIMIIVSYTHIIADDEPNTTR